MACRKEHHDVLWPKIKSVITMDDETEDGRFLGCDNQRFSTKAVHVKELLDINPRYHLREKERQKAKNNKNSEEFDKKKTDRVFDPD